MLFFDVVACLSSSLLLLLCRVVGATSTLFEPILWTASMGLGLGVASGLPCVYSLPPEAQARAPPRPLARAALPTPWPPQRRHRARYSSLRRCR